MLTDRSEKDNGAVPHALPAESRGSAQAQFGVVKSRDIGVNSALHELMVECRTPFPHGIFCISLCVSNITVRERM